MGLWRADPEDPYKRRYKDASTKTRNQFSSIGDIAERSHLPQPICTALLVREKDCPSSNSVRLLEPPADFEEIWHYREGAKGAFGPCTIWRPIPPSTDYVALGYVATPLSGFKPERELMMCVHKSVCKKASVYQRDVLWTSRNTSSGMLLIHFYLLFLFTFI